jgi:hypothetical protein
LQDGTSSIDRAALIGSVQQIVPNAEIVSDAGSELAIRISKENTRHFPELFRFLDNKKNAACTVTSYGVETTTLEEVFIRVAESCETEQQDTSKVGHIRALTADDLADLLKNEIKQLDISAPLPRKSLGGLKISPNRSDANSNFWTQFAGLFAKRARSLYRSREQVQYKTAQLYLSCIISFLNITVSPMCVRVKISFFSRFSFFVR